MDKRSAASDAFSYSVSPRGISRDHYQLGEATARSLDPQHLCRNLTAARVSFDLTITSQG